MTHSTYVHFLKNQHFKSEIKNYALYFIFESMQIIAILLPTYYYIVEVVVHDK